MFTHFIYFYRSSPSSVSSEICLTGHALSPAPLILLPQDHTLNISWFARDNVGLREFYVGVGNSSEEVLTGYERTAGQQHYALTNARLLTHAGLFYITIQAQDLALHTSSVTVGPILIDLTPPLVNGSLQVQEQQGHVIVTWAEDTFVEEEEGAGSIALQYAIGMLRCC